MVTVAIDPIIAVIGRSSIGTIPGASSARPTITIALASLTQAILPGALPPRASVLVSVVVTESNHMAHVRPIVIIGTIASRGAEAARVVSSRVAIGTEIIDDAILDVMSTENAILSILGVHSTEEDTRNGNLVLIPRIHAGKAAPGSSALSRRMNGKKDLTAQDAANDSREITSTSIGVMKLRTDAIMIVVLVLIVQETEPFVEDSATTIRTRSKQKSGTSPVYLMAVYSRDHVRYNAKKRNSGQTLLRIPRVS